MTSLPDRPNTALVVIDMQRNVVADAYDVDRGCWRNEVWGGSW